MRHVMHLVREDAGLPPGLTFSGGPNGAATLSGVIASWGRHEYDLTVTASNGVQPSAQRALTIIVWWHGDHD